MSKKITFTTQEEKDEALAKFNEKVAATKVCQDETLALLEAAEVVPE